MIERRKLLTGLAALAVAPVAAKVATISGDGVALTSMSHPVADVVLESGGDLAITEGVLTSFEIEAAMAHQFLQFLKTTRPLMLPLLEAIEAEMDL